ncbi:hypothetical protein S14_219 [Shewanella sp. phage 1/4]|uniref:hypothetical protein n=1 Tax=Shewanella phage 1/4 TaxID=1458859 RepID=UPI0004F7820C|nr:hypothetical protein S14_219 [Shewanella sp. phage 1/4]AHK11328.1 hypothetical protein S14_219 [Shewanella sp. phage 1/4]
MNTFNLTFSQTKTIINDLGRSDLESFLEAMNDQPEFLKFMGEIDSVSELISIYEGGCASGAYMPAVTYYTANQCMASDASGSVEEEIEHYEEITFNPSEESFSQFASKLCAMAVESFVQKHAEVIEVLTTTNY